jgi:glycerol-1-phosphatase
VSASSWLNLASSPAAEFDTLFVDLDGVVYCGDEAVPGAAAALAAAVTAGLRVAFVTNNASRTPAAVAAQLSSLGVAAQPDDVVTSAQSAAAVVAAMVPAGSRVLLTGGEGLRVALVELGLEPVRTVAEQPVAVVQGLSLDLNWEQLTQACYGVAAGLPWIAANPDLTLPRPQGLAPGNGAFVNLVAQVTGRTPIFTGKPYPPIMGEAVSRTGAQRPLVVGDRLDTDLAGAVASGLPGLMVLTGVHGVADLLAAPPLQRPALLAADLGGLFTAHRAPVPIGDGWRGGDLATVQCSWRANQWQIVADGNDPQTALEVIRVACAAWWAQSAGDTRGHLSQLLLAMAPWISSRGWD